MTVKAAQIAEADADIGDSGGTASDWQSLRDSGDIQFEPIAMPTQSNEPGLLERFLIWLSEMLEPVARLFGMSWPVFEKILIALAILLLLLVLWYVVGKPLLQRLRQPAPEEEEPEWTPDRTAALALLDDADRLAGEGRFAQAVHLLLQRSVGHIEDARPEWLMPASTAREIAAIPMLPERARTAFHEIAIRVERSLFALRDLDAADWQAARSAYADFALAELSG